MDPVIETIKTYNSFADEYRKRYHDDGDSNKMKPSLEKFLSLITTGHRILDIGSGAGFDAKYLSEKKYEVTSIDLADKLLEIAIEMAPKVKFIKMDMRKLTFQRESFDGIWSSASILHLPKSEAINVISSIYKILKSDGIFYLGLKQGFGEEYKTNSGDGNLNGAKRFFTYYSKIEVENILKNFGFEIIEYSEDENRGNIWMNFFCKK